MPFMSHVVRSLLLLLPAPASLALVRPPKRVAVVGGGFAGLTAARNLASHAGVEVLLCDQRSYFEYTPGILRAWVKPQTHSRLVKPLSRLLPRKAQFHRVLPGHTTRILESDEGEGCPATESGDAAALAACPLILSIRSDAEAPVFEYPCDFVILATGGELGPVSDDRQTADGSIKARRQRLNEQVAAVMRNSSSALIVGGGLTGVELAAECAEYFPRGAVTFAVGPTLKTRAAPLLPSPIPIPAPTPNPHPLPNPKPNRKPDPHH